MEAFKFFCKKRLSDRNRHSLKEYNVSLFCILFCLIFFFKLKCFLNVQGSFVCGCFFTTSFKPPVTNSFTNQTLLYVIKYKFLIVGICIFQCVIFTFVRFYPGLSRADLDINITCLLYTSPSPRDRG